ncbi:MAG: DUF4149 domain-containing protein [Thermodesulfobacteriota bacterium]
MPIASILYRLAVSCWLGGAALFTFVLTPALFQSFNRDLAGNVVGVLFPGYFRWGLACGVLALAALSLAPLRHRTASAIVIAVMLAITSAQALVIEPRAAALKKEIASFETTPAGRPAPGALPQTAWHFGLRQPRGHRRRRRPGRFAVRSGGRGRRCFFHLPVRSPWATRSIGRLWRRRWRIAGGGSAIYDYDNDNDNDNEKKSEMPPCGWPRAVLPQGPSPGGRRGAHSAVLL